jgi:thiopeptide-type bacteriocin biosynthesis protein
LTTPSSRPVASGDRGLAKAGIELASTYQHAGFFVLRAPLVPFDWFAGWTEDVRLPAIADDDSALEAALAADRTLLRERLAALLERPEVLEAIFVASPELYELVPIWRSRPDSERGLKVERALVRYASRMASRATPFGLFAGIALGRIGTSTRIELRSPADHQRRTRLDMNYLCELTSALAQGPELARQLRYRPCDSLYPVGDQLRYVESQKRDRARSYRRTAVLRDAHVDAALEGAAQGATIAELVDRLHEIDPGIEREEVEGFVLELIDSQLLVPALRPTITGPAPIDNVVAELELHPAAAPATSVLGRVRESITELDRGGLHHEPERYQSIAKDLEALPAEVDRSRLFQVDLRLETRVAELGRAVVDDLLEGVERLRALAVVADPFGDFVKRFRLRYEDRSVPLVEVLDEELGIGFSEGDGSVQDDVAPLLEGMDFPGRVETTWVPFRKWEMLLGKKLEQFWRQRGAEVILTEEEMKELAPASLPPPSPSFALSLTLVARSERAIDEGDYRAIVSPSGPRVLGRFCHLSSELHEVVAACLRAEEAQRPDALFAEVVHLPQDRLGNVLVRPVLRKHEIPFLGASGAPPDRQIPLTDLWVSVRGNRVVLHSKRLGREIVPCLTTAHTHFAPGNLPLYRFLCRLRLQFGSELDLGWPAAFQAYRFLPRIVFGKMVLERARWKVDRASLESLEKKEGAALVRAVRTLRAEYELPRYVLVEDHDHALPIDFDNALSVESFAALVRKRSSLILRELYPSSDLVVRGPGGGHHHELHLPLVLRAAAHEPQAISDAMPPMVERSARRFTVGDEWLYLKLYCGHATADQVLRTAVAPLVEESTRRGLIDRWFFVRYGDPDRHLRLRFHGNGARLTKELLPLVQLAAAPYLQTQQIWKLQCDTYERELERYGGLAGVMLSEELFHHDSEAVLGVVRSLDDDELAEARWQLALNGSHRLLLDLGFTLGERRTLAARLSARYRSEFRFDIGHERQLGARFRKERGHLTVLVADGGAPPSGLEAGYAALGKRSTRLRPVVEALRAEDSLSVPLLVLAESYLHMFCNRLLRGAARAQELVLYDFLERLYESDEARGRRRPT